MKQQINMPPLPHMGNYVRNIMKQQQISVKTLARKAKISRDNMYKLLRKEQWSVFNIRLIGFMLKTNLFSVYVPGCNQNWQQEKTLFEQRIEQLDNNIVALQQVEKSLIENNKLLTQSEQQWQREKQWLEKENELLRQLVGLKQTA